MAFASTSTQAGANFFHTAEAALLTFRSKLATRRAYLQTRRELNALPDAILADLGLSRAQIDSVARETSRTIH